MKTIVFDLDGTLIDSAPDMHVAVARMLTDVGAAPLTLAEVTSFVGNGLPKLVERVMIAAGLDQSRHSELTAQVLANYDEENGRLTRLYPGALDCLQALHGDGFQLGICTNKPEAPAHHVLAHLGLTELFPVVIGGDTLSVRKPDPEPLRLSFERLGARVSEGLYVGDSEVDAATAEACEAKFALYEGGYRKTPVAALYHQMSFAEFGALTRYARSLREGS